MSNLNQYLEKIYHEQDTHALIKAGTTALKKRGFSLSPEMMAALQSELQHFMSQPGKAMNLLDQIEDIMSRVQNGEYLSPQEAEEFLNNFKEFDQDLKRYNQVFQKYKEFLTTGNLNLTTELNTQIKRKKRPKQIR
jgi:hypothetical protein